MIRSEVSWPEDQARKLPEGLWHTLLQRGGSGRCITMAIRRFDAFDPTLEQRLDLALEVERVLRDYRTPNQMYESFRVEEELFTIVSGMPWPLAVAYPENQRWQYITAASFASLLEAVITAFSRNLVPFDPQVPLNPNTSAPDVCCLPLSSLPAEEQKTVDQRSFRLHSGRTVLLEPIELFQAVDSARSREEAAELWALALYKKNEKQGFMAGSGDSGPGYQAVLDAARAAYEKFSAMPAPPDDAPSSSSDSASQDTGAHRRPVGVHQLVGSPASPGRAEGTVVFSGSRLRVSEVSDTILVCDRLDESLLQEFSPCAVVERLGGTSGIGAYIAGERQIPCVSGVHDVRLIKEGSFVRVDGGLGLVTVQENQEL